jgi:hypothetical protein
MYTIWQPWFLGVAGTRGKLGEAMEKYPIKSFVGIFSGKKQAFLGESFFAQKFHSFQL